MFASKTRYRQWEQWFHLLWFLGFRILIENVGTWVVFTLLKSDKMDWLVTIELSTHSLFKTYSFLIYALQNWKAWITSVNISGRIGSKSSNFYLKNVLPKQRKPNIISNVDTIF